jgi:DNA-binding NarL/FixJ family response regulator
MPSLRIMLVDDHALVRAGMKALLGSFPDLEVVGETDDGAAAVELAGRLHPNVVLMDIAMHGLNGLDATARIRNQQPEVRVITPTRSTFSRRCAPGLPATCSRTRPPRSSSSRCAPFRVAKRT